MDDRYLEPHQARARIPTAYEDALGDAIKRAYGSGITDLAGLVLALNTAGPPRPAGAARTEAVYRQEIARLSDA